MDGEIELTDARMLAEGGLQKTEVPGFPETAPVFEVKQRRRGVSSPSKGLLRLAPLIVVLAPVLVIACEDDDPVKDCTDQGGVCSVGGVTGAPVYVACDGPELDTTQCRQSGRVTGSCCRPKKCADGRGICTSPCASGRRIFPSDSDCSFGGGSVTDCCEP